MGDGLRIINGPGSWESGPGPADPGFPEGVPGLPAAPPPGSAALRPDPPRILQTGRDNVAIPNYGTVNLTVQQTAPPAVYNPYIPSRTDREYYNLFVVGTETFDRPTFRIPRERALSRLMDPETTALFAALDPPARERIRTMPSLFMAENRRYGQAAEDQRALYGFVTDIAVEDREVAVSYCAYRADIPQGLLCGLLEELGLAGSSCFNELDRTHWAIKGRDLIGVLKEAGIPLPVFARVE